MRTCFISFFLMMCLGINAQTLTDIDRANHALKICALNQYAQSTDSLYQSVKTMVDSRLNEDGSVIKDFVKGQLEPMAFGNLLNELYNHTKDERYKKATNWMHHYLVMSYPRNKKTTAQNTFIYNEQQANQMKLDGLYWAVTYFAGWVSTFDARNTQAWGDIADQFMQLNTQTYNSVTGLNYTLWSSDVENDETEGMIKDGVFKGCLPQYSAMSMARMFSAVVDVLAVIPKEQPDKATLSLLIAQVAEGLQNWQQSDSKMWTKQLVYSDGESPETDEEATDLIASAYFKALRLDFLKDSDYKTFAIATYEAAKTRGCGQLLKAEYDAYIKARTPVKKPASRTPVRRTTPVKK